MADPKYDNLYGIARDQPDVYETSDLPEADQPEEIYKEESEAIEHVHISTPEAFNKFRDKLVDGSRVDFSDDISRKKPTGYRVGSWELAGFGEKETPLQKYNRLKLEIEQLAEVLSVSQDVKEDSLCEKNNLEISVEASQELFSKLVDLKLEDKVGLGFGESNQHMEGQHFSKVINQLDTFSKDLVENRSTSSEGNEVLSGNAIQLELNFNPNANLQITSRMTDLEQKLSKLESLIGTSCNQPLRLCNVNSTEGLISCCQWMMAKLSLLDATQLDSIESKLMNVNSKLEQFLNAQNLLIQDPEKDKKINELYEVSENMRTYSSLIPSVIERLIAMESMHKQGKQANQMMSYIEALQADLGSSLAGNKRLLNSVKDNINNNLSTIKNNIESLKSRVDALMSMKQ